MKNKQDNEASSFEEAFERPFDFSKAVHNPYVNHSREALEREERESAAAEQRKPARATR